jgi:predicted outer membrane protein
VTSHRRHVRQLIHGLVTFSVTTAVLISAVGSAQAAGYDLGTSDPAASTAAGSTTIHGADISTRSLSASPNASAGPLSTADRGFLNTIWLAGLWEAPAGRMAAKKGDLPRVRQIGATIAAQYAQLDAIDEAAAKKLGLVLPTQPTAQQQSWLNEMTAANGAAFDQLFVGLSRASYGKIFPIIAITRANTQNTVVRSVAQSTNNYILGHIGMLESTGLVDYAGLPREADPATGPIAKAVARRQFGGIAPSLIFLILAVAAVGGAAALAKLLRPRSFGSPRSDLSRQVPARRSASAARDDRFPSR